MKALLAGESWTTHQIHMKGRASFVQSGYGEGASHLVEAARRAGNQVDHLQNELVPEQFPRSIDALNAYDVVVLSDLASDSLLLDDQVMAGDPAVDRIKLLVDYVDAGGGLIMVGGYMSFSGHSGQARYGSTDLATVLPVEISHFDDRTERPAGVTPKIIHPDHGLVAGLPEIWPALLGYNRFTARSEATVVATADSDPLLVAGTFGRGRVIAYASDLSPHWASNEFMKWPEFPTLWNNLLTWAAGATADSRT